MELTDKDKKEIENIAKDLPDDEFKDRYGDDWKSVKMATATKMYKKKKDKAMSEHSSLQEAIEGVLLGESSKYKAGQKIKAKSPFTGTTSSYTITKVVNNKNGTFLHVKDEKGKEGSIEVGGDYEILEEEDQLEESKKYYTRVRDLADKIKEQLETLQDMLMVAADSHGSDKTEQRKIDNLEKSLNDAHSKVDDVYTWARKK